MPECRGKQGAEVKKPTDELSIPLQENMVLKERAERLRRELEQMRADAGGAQALQLAELIIDNSTAVLFRRLAAEDPKKRKMVYVSPNISWFGPGALTPSWAHIGNSREEGPWRMTLPWLS